MAARITTASLLALILEQNADTNARLDALAAQVAGQHSTPAAIAEVVVEAAPKAGKGKKASKKVAPVVSTKVPMPESVKEGFATVKATAEDMRPLNKALDWKGANAGVKATDRPQAEIKAALVIVARDHGKDVAAKALAAYKTRLAAAQKRASNN